MSRIYEEMKKAMKNKCKQDFEVQVLQSASGYYIGTLDEEGFPNCRLSVEYYKTRESAQYAFDNRTFMERESEEILFCNGSIRKCLI